MTPASLFLVLGRSRTGSNMLLRLLNQHPDIQCRGEIFRTVEPGSWEMELDQLRASQARWAGFKMFYYHGVGDADRLWGRLAGEEQMPVVHLRRRNGLRTAASRKLAMASKDWVRGASNSAEPPEDKRVTFTANELRADFEKTRDYETRFTQMFAAHPNLDIEYSDLSADPFGTCRTITDLLGLPPLPDVAEVRTQKQNPEPLPLLIENYQELSREFAGTPWAAFFDESA